MDKPEYAQKTADKISLYISHGIIPSINLITTYETLDNPINQLKIANIVKEYFLWEKLVYGYHHVIITVIAIDEIFRIILKSLFGVP